MATPQIPPGAEVVQREPELSVAEWGDRLLEHDVSAAEGFIPRSDRRVVEDHRDLGARSRWYMSG